MTIRLAGGMPRSTAAGLPAPVYLGEFVFGSGEADLESLDFAEPAFAAGLGYAGDEVSLN